MKSKFLRIQCPRCKEVHVVFGKASTRVRCKSCNILLVHGRGGKAKIRARVESVL